MQAAPTRATPMAFVRAMVLAYEKYGVDPASALRGAGITHAQLRRPGARIAAAQMQAFAAQAMRELDDEALGWFGRRLPWGSYGMLCRASLTSPNLGVALTRWCRHHRLLVDDVALELHVTADRAGITIDERRPIDPRLRELCLLTLLRYVHAFACWAVDSRIELHGVALPHPPPPHHRAYALMFPGPVGFDAPLAAMSFDPAYLELPLRRDEAALRAMLEHGLALTVLQYRRDRLLVQRIRKMPPAGLTAHALADALHLSVRTLHRRLKDEGTSLQALKDRMRLEIASEALLRTTRPVKQVASAAGFRSEKSFSRAFVQWTGVSPIDFRNAGRSGAAVGTAGSRTRRHRTSQAARRSTP